MATETSAPFEGLTPELLDRNLKLPRADRELLLQHLKKSLEVQDDPAETAGINRGFEFARTLAEASLENG